MEKDRIPELEDLMVEMTQEAISVRLDYETSGSNMDSGSIVAIHQNSPLLDDEKRNIIRCSGQYKEERKMSNEIVFIIGLFNRCFDLVSSHDMFIRIS